jgi:oxygen-dependent protoporphyrinogen oxidase
VLLRVMIGGAHDPEAVTLNDETLLRLVRSDLRTTMGIDAEPVLKRVYRHSGGIAQYTVGHQQRLDRIHERLGRLPGLWVAGSSYYGVSMNLCIAKAGEQAEEILRFVKGPPAT